MSEHDSSRKRLRNSMGGRVRYVKCGSIYHIARESDEKHHMTVCGKYVESEVHLSIKLDVCKECTLRFDSGALAVDTEAPPRAVLLGRFKRSHHNGRLRIRESS